MAVEELIERSRSGERDFTAANLSGFHLFDISLEGINLTRSNLQASRLERVKKNTKLFQADLSECNWIIVNLSRAKLIQANLSFSSFNDCCFERADLHMAQMDEGSFLEVNCKQAEMEMVSFHMSAFRRVDFEDAELRGASLGENYFVSCIFRDARGADLTNLVGNILQEVTLPSGEVVDKPMIEMPDL